MRAARMARSGPSSRSGVSLRAQRPRLESDAHVAGVRWQRDCQDQRWLVTAYDKDTPPPTDVSRAGAEGQDGSPARGAIGDMADRDAIAKAVADADLPPGLAGRLVTVNGQGIALRDHRGALVDWDPSGATGRRRRGWAQDAVSHSGCHCTACTLPRTAAPRSPRPAGRRSPPPRPSAQRPAGRSPVHGPNGPPRAAVRFPPAKAVRVQLDRVAVREFQQDYKSRFFLPPAKAVLARPHHAGPAAPQRPLTPIKQRAVRGARVAIRVTPRRRCHTVPDRPFPARAAASACARPNCRG